MKKIFNCAKKVLAVTVILNIFLVAGCATDSDLTGQSEETTLVSLFKGSKNKKAATEDSAENEIVPETVVETVIEAESVSESEVSDEEMSPKEKKAAEKKAAKAEKAAAKKLAKQKKEQEKAIKKARKEGADIPEVILASDSNSSKAYEEKTVAQESEVPEELKSSQWYLESAARKKISKTIGKIKLSANGKKGTFNISVFNREAREVPLLSKNKEGTTSSFFLKYDNKVYKLSGVSSVKTAARVTEYGIELSYLIPGKAHVLVNMEVVSSSMQRVDDMVRITTSVKNLASEIQKEPEDDEVEQPKEKKMKASKATYKSPEQVEEEQVVEEEKVVQSNKIGLKLLLDTCVGENSEAHFYDSYKAPVVTEKQVQANGDIKWFTTGNGKASFQIVMGGPEVTPFDSVTVAGFNTLNNFKWDVAVNPSKSFATVSSYNDSGVAYTWKTEEVLSEEEKLYTTYIATAAAPDEPNAEVFVNLYSKANKNPVQTAPVVKKEPEKTVKAPETSVSAQAPAVSSVPQYNDSYVQWVLNRIAELESGAKEVRRDELLILNQELDLILDYYRNN